MHAFIERNNLVILIFHQLVEKINEGISDSAFLLRQNKRLNSYVHKTKINSCF